MPPPTAAGRFSPMPRIYSDRDVGIVLMPKPSLPPPPGTAGPAHWMRTRLFAGPWSALATVILTAAVTLAAARFYQWAVADAVWEAASRRECFDRSPAGACWAGVLAWGRRFLYGRYPDPAVWRVQLAFALLAVWLLPLWLPRVTGKPCIGLAAAVAAPALMALIILGGERGPAAHLALGLSLTLLALSLGHAALCVLGIGRPSPRSVLAVAALTLAGALALTHGWNEPRMPTNLWGGLFLTLLVAAVGACWALPLGIVLALGRRSGMPVIRALSVVYIETLRAAPLVPVLFFVVVMVPLFLPVGVEINKLVLAILAIVLFASASMAEVVRGGIQSVRVDQYDAARSLGLRPGQVMTLVVLPQAVKRMIPNLVGAFIDLFKGTAVISIFGLYDFLSMTRAVSMHPLWIGLFHEAMFVAFLVYFTGSFAMSKYSRHLERRLRAGDRRRI